jgi:hypothetical protein
MYQIFNSQTKQNTAELSNDDLCFYPSPRFLSGNY